MSNFYISSTDIRVDDGHILRARLRTEHGSEHDGEIDLNQFIGNDNGRFDWGGVNFSETARNISFAIEGGANVPVLRAELQNVDGEWVGADINLGERISNENGQFQFN
ncbi:Cyanovirin-N [Daldinia caldariorum]|uniref:Cyanovirin-N n=1 Tax=Daldinia caldariorum TaxID=326644 RepID=UPI0020086C7E|nr:Cyanovirin-N [Daldinia caldariorum]KAI1473177.1 Cyanovirin-N [Daldinia caldariorum]